MYFSFSNLVVEQVLYNVLYQKATPFIINATFMQWTECQLRECLSWQSEFQTVLWLALMVLL